MIKNFGKDIGNLIDLEETKNGGVKNNPVVNFSYTTAAYENDEAAGVENFDIARNNNIPNASPVTTETNKTVLDRGYRSQGSSLSRMLVNHFWGRTSYNLNKIHDWFTALLHILSEVVTTGMWNLQLGEDTTIKNFNDMTALGTYKGKVFTGMSHTPDWFDQSLHGKADYSDWSLIVDRGNGWLRQILFYTHKANGEANQYVAARLLTTSGGSITNYGEWTSKSVEADHALNADRATDANSADKLTIEKLSSKNLNTIKKSSIYTFSIDEYPTLENAPTLPNGYSGDGFIYTELSPNAVTSYFPVIQTIRIVTIAKDAGSTKTDVDLIYTRCLRTNAIDSWTEWQEVATTNTSRATTQTDAFAQVYWSCHEIGGNTFQTGTYIGTAIEESTGDYIKFVYSCNWTIARSITILEERNLRVRAINNVGTAVLEHYDNSDVKTLKTRAIKISNNFIGDLKVKLYSEGNEVATTSQVNAMYQYTPETKTLNIVPIK